MRLKKLNLIVETNSDIKKDELIAEGYKLIESQEKKLEDLTVSELKEIADKKGIEYDKNIKKQDLIDLLQEKEEQNE